MIFFLFFPMSSCVAFSRKLDHGEATRETSGINLVFTIGSERKIKTSLVSKTGIYF